MTAVILKFQHLRQKFVKGIKLLFLFFLVFLIIFSPLILNKIQNKENKDFYNNAIKNHKIVELLNYAIKHNIDCSNSKNIKTCSNIEIELKKNNLQGALLSDDLSTLFSMYYQNYTIKYLSH